MSNNYDNNAPSEPLVLVGIKKINRIINLIALGVITSFLIAISIGGVIQLIRTTGLGRAIMLFMFIPISFGAVTMLIIFIIYICNTIRYPNDRIILNGEKLTLYLTRQKIVFVNLNEFVKVDKVNKSRMAYATKLFIITDNNVYTLNAVKLKTKTTAEINSFINYTKQKR